jgi:serine/threonine-protein kinase
MMPCPSLEQLQSLLRDQLSDAEAEAVGAHVEACALCQQSLERLTAEQNEKSLAATAHRDGAAAESGGAFLRRLEQAPPAEERTSSGRAEQAPVRHGPAVVMLADAATVAPQRLVPALEAGASPELARDILTLLRKRLRFISLVALAIYLYAYGFFAVNVIRDPAQFSQHLDLGLLTPFLLIFAGVVVLPVILWTRRPLSLGRLRGMELTLFGLLLAQQSFELAFDLFGTPQFGGVGEWAGTSEKDGGFLWFHGAYKSLSYVLLIVCYATLIPSSWRRCTLVVGVMAATPLAISAVASVTTVVSPSTFLSFHVLPMGIYLAIAVAVAAYGTHRMELLRQEAVQARKLGQYQLKQQLGKGGMGEVYLAEHVLLKRPCAIKLIRPDRAAHPGELRRFAREVRATAALTHPNTVQVFDYGTAEDGTFYYAMEYLPGLNLDELVTRHGPLPAARAVHLLRQLCGALAEAHAAGLIHRDLKPGNVIVGVRGGKHDVVKLLDFGLVRSQTGGPDETRLTQEGAIAGTPAFMSPEQAGGQENLDGRSDIYSLGALAYFLLAGQPPFAGRSMIQMLLAHISEPPKPLTEHRPDTPTDLQAVVLRCLAKEPAERFPDVASLDGALAGCATVGQWTEEMAAAWWHSRLDQQTGGGPVARAGSRQDEAVTVAGPEVQRL